MARNDPQMNLRVPMELKEKIEKAALDNGRTITAEAVFRLEQSFNFDEAASKGQVAMTAASSQILSNNLTNVITKLINNLLLAGVDASTIKNATKLIASEEQPENLKDK